ncbi:MAG TPA: hypothetical protein DCM28_17055 [Phycisphaerales bacterium]|nr:hypothetical protein [Phycisphaerales bacterium]HCD34310.1 hypothetical protein [Phycisphaerales bacterium]|tara:strand:+ start:2438 stop:4240 length:1803 start_codon:yes stop_codon:yes gene_type:complete
MPAISTIDMVVVVAYMALLVAVGAVLSRQNKNTSDYFRNGCKGTWWLVGASAFMTSFSAWTFTGASGVAYEAGWSVLIIYITNAIAFFVGAIFIAPWFRQLRCITVPEVIEKRFGPKTQQFFAWFNVLTNLVYAALWLYGLAIFCSSVLGYDKYINEVIVVVGLVVLLYSTSGGSWAVMATDFLQCLILVPITILMAYLSIKAIGGFSGFEQAITDQNLTEKFSVINADGVFKNHSYTWVWAGAMLLKNVLNYNTLNSSYRYFAVKDGWEARKAAAMAGVLMAMGAFIWLVPPMVARLMYHSEISAMEIAKPAEAAYAVISLKLLPTGLTGMMVVAMLSATMSSMDSGLNRNAGVVTQDIYPTICRLMGWTPREDKALLNLGKLVSIACGLCIICLALYFARSGGKGVFQLMLDVGTLLAMPLGVPLFVGIFIRRAPVWSCVCSVSLALCSSTVGFYSSTLAKWGWLSEPWAFQDKLFWNVGLGVLGFVITIPFWSTASEQYKKKVDDFFTTMHTPVDFEKEVGQGNDHQQLRILGIFSVIVGVFLGLLMLLPNPMEGRLAIGFVAVFVGGVGSLFVYIGRKPDAEINTNQTDSLSADDA